MTEDSHSHREATPGPTRDPEAHWTQVSQGHYDPDGDFDLTVAIVETLTDAGGVEEIDAQSVPLYDYIDVTALESLFFDRPNDRAPRDCTGTVEFHYGSHRIVVKSDGWIQVYEATDAA